MAVIVGKVRNFGTTLWNHKKKIVFFGAVAAYGINWLQLSNQDSRIRTFYALEAKRFGEKSIEPTEKLKRVTVLINEEANGRKASDCFKKNALPLLNLAGVDVTLLKVKDAAEMTALGRALDRNETDCVYVVGGDGTVGRLLDGLFASDRSPTAGPRPPVCVFPGGRRNAFLCRLAPGIFGKVDDVRRYCESAMAILDECRRDVYPMKCEVIDNVNPAETETFYVLSDVGGGWLEHCEQRKPKLWYYGSWRDWVVYALEFLKRFPASLSLRVSYAEPCTGCCRCRRPLDERIRERTGDEHDTTVAFQPAARNDSGGNGWLSGLVGSWKSKSATDLTPQQAAAAQLIDYSSVVNERCGKTHTMSIDAANFEVVCTQQKDGCGLEMTAGRPFSSRWDAMRVGWVREMYKTAFADNIDKDSRRLVESCVPAQQITIQFAYMPPLIEKLSISGDWRSLENFAEKTLRLTATDRWLELYTPRTAESWIALEHC